MAYEKIGLTPEKFWSLTWAEFQAFCKNYENNLYDVFRPVRILGATMVNLWSKKRIRPEDYISLPGDEKRQVKLMTKERFEELKKKWN